MSLSKIFLSELALLEFGQQLAKLCKPGDIIFLKGELGAGKTTLSRGFLRGLGYSGTVKSPTYTIVEPYQFSDFSVFHFDLYRITDASELLDMGFADYFAQDAICLIEWPERAESVFSKPAIICDIAIVPQGREVLLSANTERGNKILTKVPSGN